VGRSRTKKLSASGGLAPLTLHQGLCSWTPLGAPPPDPRYRLALHALAMVPNNCLLPQLSNTSNALAFPVNKAVYTCKIKIRLFWHFRLSRQLSHLVCIVLIQNWAHECDGRTDGRTDGETPRRWLRRTKHSAIARKNESQAWENSYVTR